MNRKIIFGSKEAVSLMVILLLTKFVFTTPLLLINNAGASAWISLIVSASLSFIFMQLCVALLKDDNGEITHEDYQTKHFRIMALLGGMYFYILSASFIGQYIIGAMHTSLPESPSLYISAFCLVCILAVGFLGLEPCVRSSRFFVILLLLIIGLLIFVLFEKFDYVSFTPLFGKGYMETFLHTPFVTGLFSEYFFLFYFLPFIKKKKYILHTNFITILITCICFLSVLGIYLLVIPIGLADTLNFPTHQMIFFIEGTVSQSLKPLYTFIWHISVFSYAGIVVVFVSDMLQNLLHLSGRKPLVPILSLGLIYLGFLMGDESALQNIMRILLQCSWILFPVVPVFLSLITRMRRQKCLKK